MQPGSLTWTFSNMFKFKPWNGNTWVHRYIAIFTCLYIYIYTVYIMYAHRIFYIHCIYSYYHLFFHSLYIDGGSLNNDNLRSIPVYGIHWYSPPLHVPQGFWWKYRIHRWEDRKAGDEQNPNGLGNPILKLPFLPSYWFHGRCVCVSPIGSFPFKYRPFPSVSMIMGGRVGHWNGISCCNQKEPTVRLTWNLCQFAYGFLLVDDVLQLGVKRYLGVFFPFWGGEVFTYYPTLCMIGYIYMDFFKGSILGIKKVHLWEY